MKVVILCGGKGMRLREETEHRPKPLVTIGDMPILWHIMKIYAHHGHRDFILCLGYKGEMIKDYFLNFDERVNSFTLRLGAGVKEIIHHNKKKLIDEWNITFADTGLNSDTGGRIALVKDLIGGDEDFFLNYCDGVANVDINATLRYHQAKGRVATLCGVNHINPFGVIEPQDGLVKSFIEKPKSQAFINGGFYILNKRFFNYLSGDPNQKFEHGPMEKLVNDGELAVYPHHGFWYCVDTMKHLEDLNEMYKTGQTPWMIWQENQSKSGLA